MRKGLRGFFGKRSFFLAKRPQRPQRRRKRRSIPSPIVALASPLSRARALSRGDCYSPASFRNGPFIAAPQIGQVPGAEEMSPPQLPSPPPSSDGDRRRADDGALPLSPLGDCSRRFLGEGLAAPVDIAGCSAWRGDLNQRLLLLLPAMSKERHFGLFFFLFLPFFERVLRVRKKLD